VTRSQLTRLGTWTAALLTILLVTGCGLLGAPGPTTQTVQLEICAAPIPSFEEETETACGTLTPSYRIIEE